MQTREGRDITAATEATRPGVLLTPPVDIFADSQAITVLVDMPGVTPGAADVDLHEGVLTIPGHAAAPERPNEVAVLGEYRTGAPFQRSLTVSEAIDQGRIRATLMQGVLRLRLPKTERAKPRQITIQTE
jgi:HSP20 family molecular chaperone IbpA